MQDIENIYKEYAKTVYKYIFCLTGNKELSEEIVQETFVVAIKNIDKFKGYCKVSTWHCQIAKYIWYKILKKEKKEEKISFETVEDVVVSDMLLEEKVLEKQEKIEVFKKIQTLDEQTRTVMYLRILGNLEYNEIAEIMNKTPSWARVVFFRGKQKLKEEKDEKGM